MVYKSNCNSSFSRKDRFGPKIFMNPSSNSIVVDGSENTFYKIEIVDIKGMMVYSNIILKTLLILIFRGL